MATRPRYSTSRNVSFPSKQDGRNVITQKSIEEPEPFSTRQQSLGRAITLSRVRSENEERNDHRSSRDIRQQAAQQALVTYQAPRQSNNKNSTLAERLAVTMSRSTGFNRRSDESPLQQNQRSMQQQQVPSRQQLSQVLKINENLSRHRPLSVYEKNKLMLNIHDLRQEFPQPQFVFENPIYIYFDYSIVETNPSYEQVHNFNYPMLSPAHGMLQLISMLKQIRIIQGGPGNDFVKRFQFIPIEVVKTHTSRSVTNGQASRRTISRENNNNIRNNSSVANSRESSSATDQYEVSKIPKLFMVHRTSPFMYRDLQAAVMYLWGLHLYRLKKHFSK
jgi:hypothetical protein